MPSSPSPLPLPPPSPTLPPSNFLIPSPPLPSFSPIPSPLPSPPSPPPTPASISSPLSPPPISSSLFFPLFLNSACSFPSAVLSRPQETPRFQQLPPQTHFSNPTPRSDGHRPGRDPPLCCRRPDHDAWRLATSPAASDATVAPSSRLLSLTNSFASSEPGKDGGSKGSHRDSPHLNSYSSVVWRRPQGLFGPTPMLRLLVLLKSDILVMGRVSVHPQTIIFKK